MKVIVRRIAWYKNVFKCFLNVSSVSVFLNSGGRLFHDRGPTGQAQANARSANRCSCSRDEQVSGGGWSQATHCWYILVALGDSLGLYSRVAWIIWMVSELDAWWASNIRENLRFFYNRLYSALLNIQTLLTMNTWSAQKAQQMSTSIDEGFEKGLNRRAQSSNI